MSRPEKWMTKQGVEPSNCKNVGSIKVKGAEAEKQARSYVDQNHTKNCCTITGDGVTKWELPPSITKVELMKADTGITFLYHSKLEVE